jgi:hypothetical protein
LGEELAAHTAAVAEIADVGAEAEEEFLARMLVWVVGRGLGFEGGVRCHGGLRGAI